MGRQGDQLLTNEAGEVTSHLQVTRAPLGACWPAAFPKGGWRAGQLVPQRAWHLLLGDSEGARVSVGARGRRLAPAEAGAGQERCCSARHPAARSPLPAQGMFFRTVRMLEAGMKPV